MGNEDLSENNNLTYVKGQPIDLKCLTLARQAILALDHALVTHWANGSANALLKAIGATI
jgi:hypothetical protein